MQHRLLHGRLREIVSRALIRDLLSGRPRFAPQDELMGRATGTALLRGCDNSLERVVDAVVRPGIVRRSQLDAYLAGNACPTPSVAKRLEKAVPGAGEPALWPRSLLTLLPISREALTPELVRNYGGQRLPKSMVRRGNVRPGGVWMGELHFSGDWISPDTVWRQLCRLRFFELHGVHELFWESFWQLILDLPGLAKHAAVAPHRELLFHIVERLFKKCPGYPLPIVVNWEVVRLACDTEDAKVLVTLNPFHTSSEPRPAAAETHLARHVMSDELALVFDERMYW